METCKCFITKRWHCASHPLLLPPESLSRLLCCESSSFLYLYSDSFPTWNLQLCSLPFCLPVPSPPVTQLLVGSSGFALCDQTTLPSYAVFAQGIYLSEETLEYWCNDCNTECIRANHIEMILSVCQLWWRQNAIMEKWKRWKMKSKLHDGDSQMIQSYPQLDIFCTGQ